MIPAVLTHRSGIDIGERNLTPCLTGGSCRKLTGEPYLNVIREKCSEVLHILDRVQIVAKMNKTPDEGRAGKARRMAGEGRTHLLKKSRWLLRKREEKRKAEQRFRLRGLLRYNLKTVRAYLPKEDFQQLSYYSSPVLGRQIS